MYNSCKVAIETHKTHKADSNVTRDKMSCNCDHEPTSCNLVGNGMYYACLKDKSTETQRVYGQLNMTKQSKLK